MMITMLLSAVGPVLLTMLNMIKKQFQVNNYNLNVNILVGDLKVEKIIQS